MEGTKNLISRSKYGQTPLLLLVINYKEPFYIGNLRQRLQLIHDEINEMQLRSVDDYKIDITKIVKELKINKDKIESIEFKIDSRLQLLNNGEIIKNISKNEL